MKIQRIDHLVLTVADIDQAVEFYCSVLGMHKKVSANNRVSLHFGQQKINLHETGSEFYPHAKCPIPGSADLCFVVNDTLERIVSHINKVGIEIVEGPVVRTGAIGEIRSVYISDPDGNLIELAIYN